MVNNNKRHIIDVSDEDHQTKTPRYSPETGIKSSAFGYVDIKKLEHSARMLQKNIKIILDDAPNVENLNKLMTAKEIDSLTFDNLKTNKLVHLSSILKSLYEFGNLEIFDSILENNINDERLIINENFERHDLKMVTSENFDNDEINSVDSPLRTPVVQASSHLRLETISSPENSNISDNHSIGIHDQSKNDTYNDSDNTIPKLPLIKDPHLYARVFIHKSTINNKSYLSQSELISSHNERLEFLGDSVLNNIATIILYTRYSSASEGELSKMRSLLVNNVTLAEFSLIYGFDKKLKSNINDAILRQGKQKIFADIFEAYVGALAMENHDYDEIKNWLYKLFLNRLNKFDNEIKETEEVNKDAKSELYSLVGSASFHPTYKVIKTGDGASKPFEVDCMMGHEILGTGIAPGLKEAGLRAAMIALKNKPLLEKYIQLRVSSDRSQTAISVNDTQNTNTEESKFSDSSNESSLASGFKELPLIANNDDEFDINARNKLYAILSKHYTSIPEYDCEETDDKLFKAHLKINNHLFSVATDVSKKRAMARAAKIVLDNSSVLHQLAK
ncbi:ribonuclease 3 [[Candida] jaroonii]|uniref:Ribonuclease 3 n=1 Tax=[Candida] jaroonii TaxID=467808 RepID=A0ACA9Y299_9ASCO|nr:ribonuclease 3 [[Candida] jaroonii]